jgi:two-component sensor histidine kinase
VDAHDLQEVMSDAYHHALRRFLDRAMSICGAGSAGLSMVAGGEESVICWVAVTGTLSDHEGSKMPLDRTSCGVCLDAGTMMTLADPERLFPYLKSMNPWVSEVLTVPLFRSSGIPMGTLWFVRHSPTLPFSDEDGSMAQRLAVPLGQLLKILAPTAEKTDGLVQHDAQAAALRAALDDLAEERSYREHVENTSRRVLAFKDAQIQEAHHRAKNTIQIAATVLELQAHATSLIEVRAALQESHSRLHVLAGVHELLHANPGDVREVSMPTLFEMLAAALSKLFSARPAQVLVEVAVDPIMLHADHAIPLALLANEAMTNVYKHAFTKDHPGELTITLQRLAEHGLILQVSDNGVGMAANRAGRRGLGLKLMYGFAKQLNGELSMCTAEAGCGTIVTLTIENLGSCHRRATRASGAVLE